MWTGVFYTGNEFKQVQLIQVMSGEQEGFLTSYGIGDALRPTWPKARENAVRQIQIKLYKNQTFMKSHM